MKLRQNQLKRIEISGYKSIKSCNLELKNLNVLIGCNGAGKSNLISALSLLQSVLNKQLQIAVAQGGSNSFFHNGRKSTDAVKIKVHFNSNSYGFQLMPTDDNRVAFKDEFYGYDTTETSISYGHMESKWDDGVSNRINNYVKPILEMQNWKVYHFHDTGRDSRIKQEHDTCNNDVLLNDARNLAAFLYRLKNDHPKHYVNIVRIISLVAPYFDDFFLKPQGHNNEQILLRWKQTGCDDVFRASQLSDGTLRFICLATLMLQPLELQPETIIIDEPELGLHPFAITILAEMVQSVSCDKQVILSTQSVELLNEFDIGDVIVVDRTKDGSAFKRLNEDELRSWLEADYSLGDLWKKNILGGRLSVVRD